MKSNLVIHAEHELQLLRAADPSRLGDASDEAILAVVEAFARKGQDAANEMISASEVPEDVVASLLRFDPLIPLTGQASEWAVIEQSDEIYARNKRCPHVLKRKDGTAYDTLAVGWRKPDGSLKMSPDSARDIAFPYTPKTEAIEADPSGADTAGTTA